MPLHIKAEPKDVASDALLVPEPEHSTYISGLLESPRLVNRNRDYLTYTGAYRGRQVTVAAHGIGGPSASIVVEELAQLGVRRVVRIGTALSASEELGPGDILLATAASYLPGGTLGEYVTAGYITLSATPSLDLLLGIKGQLERSGVKAAMGPVFSNDLSFIDGGLLSEVKRLRIKAVDMESATVLGLSLIRGLSAAAVLIITGMAEEGPRLPKEALLERIRAAALASLNALTE